MLLTAADFVGLAGAQLPEIPRLLGLADQVQRLAIVLEDGPVPVVGAHRGVDLEPPRQLDEELNVFTPSSWLAKARSTSES